MEKGRLPGSGTTHEGDELARQDLEIDAPQRDRLDVDLAIDLDDLLEPDDGFEGRAAVGNPTQSGCHDPRSDGGPAKRLLVRHCHRKLSIIWRNASTLSTPSGVDRLT